LEVPQLVFELLNVFERSETIERLERLERAGPRDFAPVRKIRADLDARKWKPAP